MRFTVPNLLRGRTLTGVCRCGNQGIALALAVVLLAGCADEPESADKPGFFSKLLPDGKAEEKTKSKVIGSGLVFFGVAVGDEPNAVKAAEDVLKFGGTAADAAVTLALTMTVTMPSAASLGGGGICIVHDPEGKKTEVIDFIAPPGSPSGRADRPTAVPALLRGLAALQIRYGQSDMRGLLAATEKKARFGHVVSRAFARELALAARPLFDDPAARRIFARPDGKPYEEGDRLIQADLADIYAVLRNEGVTAFYKGALAERIVKAVQDAGGSLSLDDLRNFVPRWRKPVAIPYGSQIVNFVPAPAGAGVGGALMWNMLAEQDRFRAAGGGDAQAHLLLETAKRAFAARQKWLSATVAEDGKPGYADPQLASALMANFNPNAATPASSLDPAPVPVSENPSGTGFVVVDLVGLTVACTLTNYNLFGTGRVAPGTGIVLAAAPGRDGHNALSLGPVLAYDGETFSFRFAAAGAGGAAALTATTAIAASTVMADRRLSKAIGAPRVHHGGAPDIAVLEEAVPAGVKNALERRGHKTVTVPSLGRINAVECPFGLDAASESIACFVFADPRTAGMAAEAER